MGLSGACTLTVGVQALATTPISRTDINCLNRLKPLFSSIECKRNIVFKEEKQLASSTYNIEVSTTQSGELLIAAFDNLSPESLLIHLPGDKAEAIMKEFEGEYT